MTSLQYLDMLLMRWKKEILCGGLEQGGGCSNTQPRLEGGHLKSIAALINLLLNPNPNPTHEKLDPLHQYMGVKTSPCYLATVWLPH